LFELTESPAATPGFLFVRVARQFDSCACSRDVAATSAPRNSHRPTVLSSPDGTAPGRVANREDFMSSIKFGVPLAACLAALCVVPAQAQQANMSFFVTSVGLGKGADLGGLAGADAHCQTLAKSAGSNKTWHAYLSTQGAGAVNAKDRIGKGPWMNAKGEVVAKDVAELHSAANKLTKQTALTEKGAINNGRGDTPNKHDILTGSQPDGTAFPADKDMTCKNYTSSTQGAVMMGHADRIGLTDDAVAKSWNSSHPSRGAEGGCSQADLRGTGGDGLLYCFATN
jgi:hypothetical protein